MIVFRSKYLRVESDLELWDEQELIRFRNWSMLSRWNGIENWVKKKELNMILMIKDLVERKERNWKFKKVGWISTQISDSLSSKQRILFKIYRLINEKQIMKLQNRKTEKPKIWSTEPWNKIKNERKKRSSNDAYEL